MRYKLVLLTALLGLPLFGSVTTYTDVAAWAVSASDAPNVVLDGATISNGQLAAPDLTITTNSGMDGVYGPGNGFLIQNLWADDVGTTTRTGLEEDTTTFTFDKPVYAFAGNFNLQGGTGAGLELYTNGPIAVSPNQTQTPHGTYGTDYDGFFGFVSTTPFTSILFASSYGDQSFTLSDITYAIDPPPAAEAPEPSSIATLGLICIGLGLVGKRLRG